jgi:fructoselysine 6-kinase
MEWYITGMKMAAFTVAALDRFPDWAECHPGGNAMNQSVHFKQLGWETFFIGALGNDKAGDLLLQALSKYGVDCSFAHVVDGNTAGNTLLVDESGERFEAAGAWQGGVYETYRLSKSDWTHLSKMDLWVSHANHNDYLEALKRKNPAQFMAVDFLHLRDFDLLVHSLKAVDIAFFGGTPDMEAPLSQIAKAQGALVVLTLGAAGSVAFLGDKVFRQEALPLEKVIDTTGCGDAFQAAFTNSFYRFKDVPRALLEGAVRGKQTASRPGALPWPPKMTSLAKSAY